MILHLIVESQFTDYVINQFSAPEMHSDVVIIHVENYIKHEFQKDKVRVIIPFSEDFKRLLSSLVHYSAVVLHGLFQPWCETILRNVPENVKVAWVFWGGEIYGRQDLRESFLSKRSKMLLRLHEFKLVMDKKKDFHYELPKELFQRIDYCLTDVHEDFDFVKSYCDFDAKELWYNYYSVDETLGELHNQSVEGDNIFIGNSCNLECNHLDGFKAAKKLFDKNHEIIVPLSYGEPWLRRSLLKIGGCMFGKRFHPLVDFMPLGEYNKLIKSCSVAIMPHYRPQAFGNIITALWLGARVYMSEKSHLYAFFKRIGIKVFSIETDISRTKHPLASDVSVSDREENRRIIAMLYEKNIMNCKNQEIVKILES